MSPWASRSRSGTWPASRQPARPRRVRRGPRLALPPRQGSAGLARLLLALARRAGAGAERPELADALRCVGASRGSASLVVVVSDFRGPRDWRPPLMQLAGRHDVLAVEIRDPREEELVDVGDLWFPDPETGRRVRVDTATRACASVSPRPPRPSGAASRGRSRRRPASHVVLSTAATGCGPWRRTCGRRR